MVTRYKIVRDRHSVWSGGKYQKYYAAGTTVSAVPNTLGLACFKTKRQAEATMKRWGFTGSLHFKIIRIKTIGRGTVPKVMSMGQFYETDLDRFYTFFRKMSKEAIRIALTTTHVYGSGKACQGQTETDTMSLLIPPEGTICYPAVKVLT